MHRYIILKSSPQGEGFNSPSLQTLNESIGTKLYAARYSFTAKGVEPINGTRFRISQDITKTYIGENSYNLYMNAETQYDKVRKRQNFVGIGLKVIFNDKQNQHKKKSGLGHRMMETIVRDVDIVTNSTQSAPDLHDLYIGNNKIKRVLYVGAADGHRGTGTKNNPLSFQQLNAVRHDDAAIIVTAIATRQDGRNLNANERQKIQSSANILNGKRTVLTTKAAKDHTPIAVTIHADSMNDIEVSSHDNSATHINVEGSKVSTKTPHGRRSTATLLRAAAHRVATQQVIINNLMNPANAGVGGAPAAGAPRANAGVANAGAGANAGARPQTINELLQVINLAAQRSQNAALEAQNAQTIAGAVSAAQRAQAAALEAQEATNQIHARNNGNEQNIIQAVNDSEQAALYATLAAISADNVAPPQLNVPAPQPAVNAPIPDFLNPGVDVATLTPAERELYNLITQVANLQTNDPNNLYVKRQRQYDEVVGIINANPDDTVNQIRNRINARNDLNYQDKLHYSSTATHILSFDGRPAQAFVHGGQQGIGFHHTAPKDISMVSSVERLRETYGILDGNIALSLAREFVIEKIKRDINNPNANNQQIINLAIQNENTPPSQAYLNAVGDFVAASRDLNIPANRNNAALIAQRDAAKRIIDDTVSSSNSAVNNAMAAYRALGRMDIPVYTEQVTGRYNDREFLAYALVAQLDVNEIRRNFQITNNGNAPTAREIFNEQKTQIENLIHTLGIGQRAYNMDLGSGRVDTGGSIGRRRLNDVFTCSHGFCTRIMDTTMHHSKVALIDATPQIFTQEFTHPVITRVNALPEAEKQAAINWITSGNVQANIANRAVSFTDPNAAIPETVNRILTKVTQELDTRYNFTSQNHKLQLVKERNALDIFNSIEYLQF